MSTLFKPHIAQLGSGPQAPVKSAKEYLKGKTKTSTEICDV
jgi:hypothetical protein